MDVPTLLTVRQFAERHPAFPEGTLRDRIFHARENGLADAGVIIRHGRRVLIDEGRFFEYLRQRNSAA